MLLYPQLHRLTFTINMAFNMNSMGGLPSFLPGRFLHGPLSHMTHKDCHAGFLHPDFLNPSKHLNPRGAAWDLAVQTLGLPKDSFSSLFPRESLKAPLGFCCMLALKG